MSDQVKEDNQFDESDQLIDLVPVVGKPIQ